MNYTILYEYELHPAQ